MAGRAGHANKPPVWITRHHRRMPSWEPADNHDPIVDLGKAAIGTAVRARRLELGWPQRWLAFQALVSQPVISRLESGKLDGIRWQTLARIVGVLAAGRGLRFPGIEDGPLSSVVDHGYR